MFLFCLEGGGRWGVNVVYFFLKLYVLYIYIYIYLHDGIVEGDEAEEEVQVPAAEDDEEQLLRLERDA